MTPVAPLLANGGLAFGASVIVAAGLVLGMYWLWRRRRDPAERERLRRLGVNATGRTTDGAIVDIQQFGGGGPSSRAMLIFYEYSVNGVNYSTAQDISALGEITAADLFRCLGSARVKYRARNPSDSIVICEEWSGLLSPPGSTPERLSALSGESSRATT